MLKLAERARGSSRTWARTNGTYVDHTYERKKSVNLMHGGEVQLGELRFKLVSASPRTAPATSARAPTSPSATA